MKIQLFCTLFVLSAGSVAFADTCIETTPSFLRLSDCRECFYSSYTGANTRPELSEADKVCAGKMDATAYCTDKLLLAYMIGKSLTREAVDAARDNFAVQCRSNPNSWNNVGNGSTTVSTDGGTRGEAARLEAERLAAERARQLQVNRAGSVSNSPTTNNGGGGSGGLGNIGDALSGVASGIGNWFQNGSPRENNGLTELPAVPGTDNTASGSRGGIGGTLSRGLANALDNSSPRNSPTTSFTPTQIADARSQVRQGRDPLVREGRADATDAARDLHNDGSGLGQDADQAVRRGDGAESEPTPRTGISGDSDVVKQRLITEIQSKLVALKASFTGVGFTNTATYIGTIETDLNKYLTDREKCTQSAERAQFLCAEGSSPGAQASRAVINLAGPVLAGITSIQRTCGSTANVTKLVSGLMTVAKGVCIGAKVTCDMSCNEVLKNQLPELKQKLGEQGLIATIETEWRSKGCTSAPPTPACSAATPVYTQGRAESEQYVAVISVEEGAHVGTVAGLKKHCDDKIIDIAMMGANIASLAAARNSAERCAEQTAGQNASGDSTVAAGMYCDQASNQQTQFCICQRNPMETTCPEYLASQQSRIDQLNAESDARAQGLNLRPGSGASAFAGGSSGATPGSSSGLAGGLDLSGGTSGSSAGVEGVSPSPSAENMVPIVAGGASAGAGFGSSARSGSDAVAKPGTVTDKAPSALKSLASSIGGLFGGKGESSDNGAISARAPSAETVQQRRASERLAAEISPANGKSNWQKVREQYLSSEPSFIFGQ